MDLHVTIWSQEEITCFCYIVGEDNALGIPTRAEEADEFSVGIGILGIGILLIKEYICQWTCLGVCGRCQVCM